MSKLINYEMIENKNRNIKYQKYKTFLIKLKNAK